MRAALHVGRLDWTRAIAELSVEDVVGLLALRTLEPILHERDVWHTTSMIGAWAGRDAKIEDIRDMLTEYTPKVKQVGGNDAARLARQERGGNVGNR